MAASSAPLAPLAQLAPSALLPPPPLRSSKPTGPTPTGHATRVPASSRGSSNSETAPAQPRRERTSMLTWPIDAGPCPLIALVGFPGPSSEEPITLPEILPSIFLGANEDELLGVDQRSACHKRWQMPSIKSTRINYNKISDEGDAPLRVGRNHVGARVK